MLAEVLEANVNLAKSDFENLSHRLYKSSSLRG